jgi:hypothetical protein
MLTKVSEELNCLRHEYDDHPVSSSETTWCNIPGESQPSLKSKVLKIVHLYDISLEFQRASENLFGTTAWPNCWVQELFKYK